MSQKVKQTITEKKKNSQKEQEISMNTGQTTWKQNKQKHMTNKNTRKTNMRTEEATHMDSEKNKYIGQTNKHHKHGTNMYIDNRHEERSPTLTCITISSSTT